MYIYIYMCVCVCVCMYVCVCEHIYINIYECIHIYQWPVDIMIKIFANGLGNQHSILGRVISKTQKNGTLWLLA